MGDMIAILLVTQTIMLPVLGCLYLGIKNENENRARHLREALQALRIISISRGRHL